MPLFVMFTPTEFVRAYIKRHEAQVAGFQVSELNMPADLLVPPSGSSGAIESFDLSGSSAYGSFGTDVIELREEYAQPLTGSHR